MVVHPPSTTHRQLDDAALAESGITAGLLRVSVGLEDLDDLVADFEIGLEAARATGRCLPRCRLRRAGTDRPGAGRPLGARPIASPAATLARARAARAQSPGPARSRRLAPADLGQLRRRPDHRPVAARGRRDDGPPAADVRLPLRVRLRRPPSPRSTTATTRVLGAGARERARTAPGLPDLHARPGSRCRCCSSPSSIIVCTLDRTPRLWRQSSEVRVVQPDPFYDPKLPDRAAMDGVGRRGGPRRPAPPPVQGARGGRPDGRTYLYGDRHQYTKLATLLTHLGLILFIVAAAVTTKFGDEQPLLLVEGGSLTVQPIGSPGILVVKNLGFEAPGFLETGQARDFTTELAVYRNGQEIAHKTIRVNDPLEVEGYSLHENNFGPAPEIYRRRRRREAALAWPCAVRRRGGRHALRLADRARPRHPASSSCSGATPTGSRRSSSSPAGSSGEDAGRASRSPSRCCRSPREPARRTRLPGPTSASASAASPTTRC